MIHNILKVCNSVYGEDNKVLLAAVAVMRHFSLSWRTMDAVEFVEELDDCMGLCSAENRSGSLLLLNKKQTEWRKLKKR